MVYLILPTYNEEKNIPRLLKNTLEELSYLKDKYHMIFINDGSTDNTKKEIFKFKDRISLEVLDHNKNFGVGEAFRTGFARVLTMAGDDDIVVTKESDNTSDVGILRQILKKIKNGDDVVLASCFAKDGGIINSTWDRYLCSAVGNFLLKLFFSIKGINTYSSFYRAYRVSILKKAFAVYGGNLITEDGFACMVELLIKLSRITNKISEVPMVLKADIRIGCSKMKKAKTIIAYLRIMFKEGIFQKFK